MPRRDARAEVAAGIVKNTKGIPSVTGTAHHRVPDILDRASRLIGDVKANDTVLRLTNQLRDFILFAEKHQYRLILLVKDPTKVHPNLRKAIEAIGGEIRPLER